MSGGDSTPMAYVQKETPPVAEAKTRIRTRRTTSEAEEEEIVNC
ncbi:unnamed protein product [Nezara viridula]|uniref:Uncharacterized protein n=1 Tax=Nezara viridula TaxID=85310 RepID=A0A9P0HSD5_NEZVI|nr:unnamed protein product [Nezara viridula]